MQIIEMALNKLDAMDRCISLGEKFTEHFNKLFTDKEYEKNHHLAEMQAWWDKVRKIKLSYNKKLISNRQLIDWFFTAGQDYSDLISTKHIIKYKELISLLLNDRNATIKEIFTNIL